MKRTAFFICFVFIAFYFGCKKPAEKNSLQTAPLTGSEVDVQKIKKDVGIPFEILKTEAIGYMPVNKFYWVCLEEKEPHEKIKKLANAIIQDTIAKKPKTYSSFKIHFFLRCDLNETLENSKSWATAVFLPEGEWSRVGRVPINNYSDYSLMCVFNDQ